MAKATQCDRIIQYMEQNGSITAWEAMKEFSCMRLASRIADIKKRGIPIRTKTVHGTNRFGDRTAYAQYSIIKQEENNEQY